MKCRYPADDCSCCRCSPECIARGTHHQKPIPLEELVDDPTPIEPHEQLSLVACFNRIGELHAALALARDFVTRMRRTHARSCARYVSEAATVCGCGASVWNATVDELLERTRVPR